MRTNILGLCSLVISLFYCLNVNAKDPNWTVDMSKYRYSMRAYLSIVLNDDLLKNVSNYEIAAFHGKDTVGVSEIVQLTPDNTVAYIAIGSNQESGDEITFNIYNKTLDMYIYNVLPLNLDSDKFVFQADVLRGEASSPLLFSIKKGDVNGDGNIDIVDETNLISIVKNEKDANLASDVNGDGKTDVKDIKSLSDIIIKKN